MCWVRIHCRRQTRAVMAFNMLMTCSDPPAADALPARACLRRERVPLAIPTANMLQLGDRPMLRIAPG